ncbi:MAG TPA: hypothetical protein VEK15_03710 [Vicinamibacteria bacterium]|nr:hypothetical protein [Vicinamibacteria bacterium]
MGGEPYYVDFLAEANPMENDRCAAQNLVIELRVRPPFDRSGLEFRHDFLRYEGWLVHEDVEGGASTSHFSALGKHGEPVRFRFEPLRQPLGPGAASTLHVVTEVSGSVEGRKRPDGDIDLVVRADELSLIEGQKGLKLPSGAGGEKKLTVQPGEVIRIELPHPSGRSVHRLPPELGGQPIASLPDVRSLGDGSAITVDDGVLVVDIAELYRGRRTSLTLSVTPLE